MVLLWPFSQGLLYCCKCIINVLPPTTYSLINASGRSTFLFNYLIANLFAHRVQLPNTVGFIFGIAQMALYLIYKDAKKVSEETKLHVPEHIVDLVKLSTIVCPEINTVVPLSKASDNEAIGDPAEKEKAQETKEDMNETIKA